MGDIKMSVSEKINVFWHDSDDTNLQAVKGRRRGIRTLGTCLQGRRATPLRCCGGYPAHIRI